MSTIINPEIKKVLNQYKVEEGEGLLYLLALYHDITPGRLLISELVRSQINLTKIVDRDYENPGKGKIIWNVPLYSSEVIPDQWDWVQNFREEFGKIRKDAIGDRKGTLTKMKKYFAEHPEVRKEDIQAATMAYLTPFIQGKQDPKYLQRADYFISKMFRAEGGVQYTSRLDMYLEIMEKRKADPVNHKQLNQVVK